MASRKLTVAFRVMLEELQEAAYAEGQSDDGHSVNQDCAKATRKARRKVERYLLPLLDALDYARSLHNGGYWSNAAVPGKLMAEIEAMAPMHGNKFTAGHAIDYAERNARRAPKGLRA